jgi:hypothetical protein
VAAGDVNADGKADIITAAGPGGMARVCVWDGETRKLVYDFFAADAAYRGGLLVAAGDLDNDGLADIVTSTQGDAPPEVTIFRGSDTSFLSRQTITASAFAGGARLALVDADNDGLLVIAVGTGPGEGKVAVVEGRSFTPNTRFTLYGNAFDKDLFVAANACNPLPHGPRFAEFAEIEVRKGNVTLSRLRRAGQFAEFAEKRVEISARMCNL